MNHHLLLIVHLIAACIWVGGHLYLVTRVFPSVLTHRDAQQLLAFEQRYEPLGIGALLALVITGLLLSRNYHVSVQDVLAFNPGIARLAAVKLMLLLATICFALSALTRVIPTLKHSTKKLPEMAAHATAVTLIGLAMVVLGSYGRYGGL